MRSFLYRSTIASQGRSSSMPESGLAAPIMLNFGTHKATKIRCRESNDILKDPQASPMLLVKAVPGNMAF